MVVHWQGGGGGGRRPRLHGVGTASCRLRKRHGAGHRHGHEGVKGTPCGLRLRATHRVNWLGHIIAQAGGIHLVRSGYRLDAYSYALFLSRHTAH